MQSLKDTQIGKIAIQIRRFQGVPVALGDFHAELRTVALGLINEGPADGRLTQLPALAEFGIEQTLRHYFPDSETSSKNVVVLQNAERIAASLRTAFRGVIPIEKKELRRYEDPEDDN